MEILSKIDLTKEQKQQIDSLFLCNYGKKIPYQWHRLYTAYTGKFDPYYYPELLFISEFERYMNINKSYSDVFSDKNVLPLIANNAHVHMPDCYYRSINGQIINHHNQMSSIRDLYKLKGEYFIKPTINTSSGIGCEVICLNNGRDEKTGRNIESIIKGKKGNWVLQERIKCHETIRCLYSESVNTFRIMTYIWKNEIYHSPIVMRIGRGMNNVDNTHAGGIFIAIEDSGEMHEKAFTEFKDEYKVHPDSHVVFEDYRIQLTPKIIEASKRCQLLIPQVGCVNWDFTIDYDGTPILIEANLHGGGVWLFEMAHGKGVFGKQTPEILQWQRFMNKTMKRDRIYYCYGNNVSGLL